MAALQASPNWTASLHPVGLYFEVFVDDAPSVLKEYYKEAVTSFGVHDSSRKSHSLLEYHEKESATQESKDCKEVHTCIQYKVAKTFRFSHTQKPESRVYWSYNYSGIHHRRQSASPVPVWSEEG